MINDLEKATPLQYFCAGDSVLSADAVGDELGGA